MSYRTYTNQGREEGLPRLLCSRQTECGDASCFVSEMEEEIAKALTQPIKEVVQQALLEARKALSK